jgi:hypothetical protein
MMRDTRNPIRGCIPRIEIKENITKHSVSRLSPFVNNKNSLEFFGGWYE